MSRMLDPGDYNWAITLGKALRDALVMAVPVAGGVAIAAVAGVLEPDKMAELGVPVWALPLIAGGFQGARNFLRLRLGWPVVVAMLMLMPAPAHAQSVGEILEGLTNPIIVVGAAYRADGPVNPTLSRFSVILTANIAGPKMGTIPCYLGGVGVGLGTISPGLEEAPIAAWSIPLVTCAPFGEQVVLQGGMSSDFSNVPDLGGNKAWYFGLGAATSSPNTLKAKRVARREAKERKKAMELQQSHPTPTAAP